MNGTQASGIRSVIKAFLLTLACFAVIYGFFSARKAGKERAFLKAAEHFEIEIKDKTNGPLYNYETEVDFSFVIRNNSDMLAYQIIGAFEIMDADGNLLSSGRARFDTDFVPDSEEFFTMKWTMDITENALEIRNTDFSMLSLSFKIEEILFEGGGTYTSVEVEPYIKLCTPSA